MSNDFDFSPCEVPPESEGMRLDQFLASRFARLSRSRWTKLIDSGAVFVDGHEASPAQKLKVGQKIGWAKPNAGTPPPIAPSVHAPEFHGVEPTVIFEDNDLAVLNKPCGLTVHPGNGIVFEETLAAWLAATGRVQGLTRPVSSGHADADIEEEDALEVWGEGVLGEQRAGIVHRLDRGTSGAIVVAKNPFTHAALSRQFATREAGRLYWAVVRGNLFALKHQRPSKLEDLLGLAPSPVALRVQELGEGGGPESCVLSFASRLDRDPRERTRFRVSPGSTGKRAVTHVAEISRSPKGRTLLECKLETGRTHQIRVHLSFLGLAILGDGLYGGEHSSRLWLHAHALTFDHPRTGARCVFEAPLPEADLAWLAAEGLTTGSRGDLWTALKSRSLRDGQED
ncbi:MAG: RluA family pseudouridine synthase [Bdellovibrionales bacterium]|nr:RluA family pseudouridine synthase [Bdellovibrionales bacterium]